MNKRLRKLMVLFLVLAGSIALVMGQSGDEDEQAQQQTEQTNEDETETNPAADITDTFTPSEEISEDLSVSFPVDI